MHIHATHTLECRSIGACARALAGDVALTRISNSRRCRRGRRRRRTRRRRRRTRRGSGRRREELLQSGVDLCLYLLDGPQLAREQRADRPGTTGAHRHVHHLRECLQHLPASSLRYGGCSRGGELRVGEHGQVHQAATAHPARTDAGHFIDALHATSMHQGEDLVLQLLVRRVRELLNGLGQHFDAGHADHTSDENARGGICYEAAGQEYSSSDGEQRQYRGECVGAVMPASPPPPNIRIRTYQSARHK